MEWICSVSNLSKKYIYNNTSTVGVITMRKILWLFFRDYFSGGVMVFLLLGCGIYLTVQKKFFQVRGFRFIFKNTVGTLLGKTEKSSSSPQISPFQAVTTALAGTMGVGNIAGVATALVAGGPGAVFWMWVSALFGMMTKYSEIFLAVKYRRRDSLGRYYGGPMYYIEDGLGKKWLAGIFALLCTICAVSVGNLTQVNSVSTSMYSTFSIPLWVSGLAVAACVALVVVGGVKRIGAVTELVIPFISIIYICISIAFLFLNRVYIPDALSLILSSAFSLRPVTGGFLGYGISRALKFGLSRGVFTNEAGLGSAPIAHASADCKSPAHQAVWGIFEVFLDTIVVCTLTALVLLTADGGSLWQSGADGAPLTSAAFESAFGGFGGKFIAVSIVFFAVSAILGWYYYGETALGYLFGRSRTALYLYRFTFLSFVFLGSVWEMSLVWSLTDIFIAFMAIPNIIALFALGKYIGLPPVKPHK